MHYSDSSLEVVHFLQPLEPELAGYNVIGHSHKWCPLNAFHRQGLGTQAARMLYGLSHDGCIRFLTKL